MTKFEDGPAAGETLKLRRSPLFLRVVTDPRHDNRIDALDQIDDKPEEFENLTAYVRVGKVGGIFMDFGGKDKHKSGRYAYATYVVIPDDDQPEDHVMRDNFKWQAWCKAMMHKLKYLPEHGVA